MKPESQCSAAGDTECGGPHHLVTQKRYSLWIIVETVGRMNEANKGTGNRLLLFSEDRYHFNVWENQC